MALKAIKRCIEYGLFNEARRLIEQHKDARRLIDEELRERKDSSLPLLVMCTLIADETSAVNLCATLLDKGYRVDISDLNGLCALNYAIIFEKVNLVHLFLNTFDFNLDSCYDCYNNSLLHYAFAISNEKIIELFTNIYKKYYEWNAHVLAHRQNRDGLSVLDLYNYSNTLISSKNNVQQRSYSVKDKQMPAPTSESLYRSITTLNTSTVNTSTLDTTIRSDSNSIPFTMPPKGFFERSNPLIIAKHVKQLYNSKLTMKTVAMIDKNKSVSLVTLANKDLNKRNKPNRNLLCSSKQEFQTNILYKIKYFNRPKTAITPISPNVQAQVQPEDILNETSVTDYEETPRIEDLQKAWDRKKARIKRERDQLSCSYFIRNKKTEGWKNDIGSLFDDFALIHSQSYRPPLTCMPHYTSIDLNLSANEYLGKQGNLRIAEDMNTTYMTVHSSINSNLPSIRSNVLITQNETATSRQKNDLLKAKSGAGRPITAATKASSGKNQH